MEIKVNQTDLGVISGVVTCSFMVKVFKSEQIKNISVVCTYGENVITVGTPKLTTVPQLIQVNREELCIINKKEDVSGNYSIVITATNNNGQGIEQTIAFQYQDFVPSSLISGGIIRYQNYTPKVGEVVVVDNDKDADVEIDLDENAKTETFNFKLPKGSSSNGKGINGKSAYELAVDNGYTGTLTEWLLSLKGDKGESGINGKSAYELAVQNGFLGTLAEWLLSLKGDKGDRGEQGIKGDKGDKGADGAQGIQGERGETGEKGADGKDGLNGKDGVNGTDGKSAYELAVDNGFSGTLAEWLLSLKGADGKDGAKGDKGDKGDKGAQGLKGDSGVEQQIVIDSALTSYTIKPNILYVFPELSQLDVSFDLTDLNPNIVNDYHFTFINGSAPCELNLPETVNIGDLDIQPNTVCEISIINGLLSFKNWSIE